MNLFSCLDPALPTWAEKIQGAGLNDLPPSGMLTIPEGSGRKQVLPVDFILFGEMRDELELEIKSIHDLEACMFKKLAFIIAMALFMVLLTLAQSGIIAPGAKVEKLAGGFSFTEGPAADKDGNVFFTDQPNDRILKWGIDGKLSTFMQPSGRSNGMNFDKQGNLISCADEYNELWLITMEGKKEILIKDFGGKLLNGPNDVFVRSDGAFYLSDPFYKRPWWKHNEMPQEKQCVYFSSPKDKKLVRVVEDLVQPNGLIGTPDGKHLFVADIGANKTYVYDIQQDGTLTGKRLFCELGSDGMTIDKEGNLYLTGKGVTVFNKEGQKIEHVDIPEPWTANVCFGGIDRQTLFITASKGLYALKMNTHGAYIPGK